MATEKFDKNKRTFETRLLFIQDIFSHKYEQEKILASSIQHKLDVSLEQYKFDVWQSELQLLRKDPLKTLRRINNKEKKL